MILNLKEWQDIYNIPTDVIDNLFDRGMLRPSTTEIGDAMKELDINTLRWFEDNHRNTFRYYNMNTSNIVAGNDNWIGYPFQSNSAMDEAFAGTDYSRHVRAICNQKIYNDKPTYFDIRVVNDVKDFTGYALVKGNRIKYPVGKYFKNLPWLYKKSDSDIESMVNILKAKYIRNVTIEEVTGEDIRKFYHQNYYAEQATGSLANSCMRYGSCQEYLYIYMQDGIRMIIVLDQNGKLVGRAIVELHHPVSLPSNG